MGRAINYYTMFLVVTILLFHFGGFISDTPISFILGKLGVTEPETITNTGFYKTLLAAMLIGVAGIAIGTLNIDGMTLERIQSYGFIVFYIIPIGMDLIAIFNQVKLFNVAVATIIFAPLMVCFLLSCYEFWRGRD